MATAQAEVLPIVLEAQDNTRTAWDSLRRSADESRQALDLVMVSFEKLGSDTATSSVQGLSSAVRLLANPYLALAAAIGAVGYAAVKVHNDLSRIGNAADDIGVSAKAVDGLQIALSKVGGEGELAAKSLQNLQTELDKSRRDGGYLEDLFAGNGKSINDASGRLRPISAAYRDIATFIRSAENETERLEIATNAFGQDAGPKMVAVIMSGADALDDLAKKSKDALDPAVKQAQEFDRLWKEITKSGEGFGVELRNMVLPVLTEATSLVMKLAAWGGWKSAQQSVYVSSNANASRLMDNQNDIDRFYSGVLGNRFSTVTPSNRPAPNDEGMQRALDSVSKHIALMEADAKAVGATAGEHERLRVQAELLAAAQRAGLTVTAQQAAQFDALAKRAAAAADALAIAKLKSDALFDRDQLGRTQSEQQVYSRLRSAGVDPNSAQGELVAGQLRLNQALADTKDIASDALKTFISDLRQGKSAADALADSLNRIADKLMDKALDSVVSGAFKGISNGGLASIFTPTGHGGAVIGEWSTGSKAVNPAAFFGAPRYHSGGLLGLNQNEVPFIGLKGEEVGFPEQLRAKYGGKSNVSIGVKVINNHPGADVAVGEPTPNGRGGFDLEVMIDQITAKAIARPGSASNLVLSTAGVRTPLARR